MRRLLIIPVIVGSLAMWGCGEAGNAADINRICKDHGGPISSDYRGGVVICADKVARDAS